MTCDRCSSSAQWRIVAQSKGFSAGRGGRQRNAFACDTHKETLTLSIREEIVQMATRCGNPFFEFDKEMDLIVVRFQG